MKHIQIGTAIPYMNGKVHIGNIMDQTLADIFARYHRLAGDEVQFLAGSDEHGVKVYNTAKEVGKDTLEMLDENVASFQEVMKAYNMSNDDFIRTTDQKRHWPTVQDCWKKWEENGDIEKRKFSGLYCEGCEMYIRESDLDESGNCPNHSKPPKRIEEENYFFLLSKYEDWLTEEISSDRIRVVPEFRKKEMLEFIKQGLEDVSFSREKAIMPWGIPVPGDDDQVMYVWPDALLNYVSGLGYTHDPDQFERFGKGTYLNVIGKDISRFHVLYYQAMLKSAGLTPSKNLLVHGFISNSGAKLSKSLGNIIDPLELLEEYGSDAVKFFIATAAGVGQDIDYTQERFQAVYNDALANNYGNYVNRVITLCQKYEISKTDKPILDKFGPAYETYQKAMSDFDSKAAVEVAMNLLDTANKFLNEQEPWKMEAGEERDEVMVSALEYLYHITVLLSPVIPLAARKVFEALDVENPDLDPDFRYTSTDFQLTKPNILFERK